MNSIKDATFDRQHHAPYVTLCHPSSMWYFGFINEQLDSVSWHSFYLWPNHRNHCRTIWFIQHGCLYIQGLNIVFYHFYFFLFLIRLHFSITRSLILLGFAFHLDFSLHSILIHLKDNGFYQYCVYSCLHFLCISLILHVLTIFVNACEVLPPPPLLCLCLFCYCQLQLVDLWHIEIGYLFNNNKNKNRASTDIGKSLESHVLVFTLYQFHSFNYWGRSIIDSWKGQIERSAIKCWGEEVH